MEALEAAKIAQAALDDKLGQDIQVLNLKGLSNVADCFVIASGKNVNHLRAMADEGEQNLFQAGVKMHHSEGYSTGTWILLDFGNLLIHLFNEEQREFYGLEHVWGDAKPVE